MSSASSRLSKTPELFLADSALAAHLLGTSEAVLRAKCRSPCGTSARTLTGKSTSSLRGWRLDGNILSIAKGPACPVMPGDGTFRGLSGIVGTGPNDMWLSPEGWLDQITSATIPYNSPQGQAGF